MRCPSWKLVKNSQKLLIQIKHYLNIPYLDMIHHCMYILFWYIDNHMIQLYFHMRNRLGMGCLHIRLYLGVNIKNESVLIVLRENCVGTVQRIML